MKKTIVSDRLLSNLLAIYCMLMPFEEALASSFGSILKLLGIIIIIYSVIVYSRSKIKIQLVHILLVLWLFLSISSYFWSESIYWWSYFFRIYIGQIAFFLVLTTIPIRYIDLKKLRNGMILGASLTAIIIMFSPESMQFTDEGRRTIMLFNSSLDPNIVAAILALGFFMVLEIVLKKSEYKRGIIAEMCILVLIVIGIFYTGSRGGIIAVFVSFIFWVLFMHNRISRRYSTMLILLSVCIIFIGFSRLPETLLARFTLNSLLGINEIETGSHSRFKIWSYTLNLFLDKPIFGYGIGNFFSAISSVYKVAASHNMYILVLIESGIFGFILFMYPVYSTIKGLFKCREYTTAIMFISILIICFFLDGITYKFFWVSWVYAFIMKNDAENNCIDKIDR